MKKISIWEDTTNIEKYDKLNKDTTTDVLIIGGGITGISTLYNLNNSKLKVILVEQNRIGMGVTGKSTGKLTYLQNDLLDKIRNNFNDDILLQYIESQRTIIKKITNIIKKENIDCELEKVSSSIYTNKDDEITKLLSLKKLLEQNNIKVKNIKSNLVESKYNITVDDTYHFHPLKFIEGLLKNNKYPIYENTSIKKIEKDNDYYICHTDKYKIKAKYIVIASHYPFFNIPYLFPIKGYLEKSYLSASNTNIKPVSLISYSYPFISIRNYKDYLIYLSNSHSLNKDIDNDKNFKELKKKLKDLNLTPEYLWSNIDIITNDGLPYIGKIKDNLLIGTGYNTWGLANGFLAGTILTDIINNKENKYIDLFNPNRINISGITGIVSNGIKNIDGYIKGFMNTTDNKTCPHMGCKLIYNKVENTWDCPCHGSRFNKEGKCISGPSNKDIE